MKLLQELTQLTESQNTEYVIDNLKIEHLHHYLTHDLERLASESQKLTKESDSVPAGPDSSKFTASRGGMIELSHNVHIHGGQYGISETYQLFFKIGGGLSSTIKEKLKKEVHHIVEGYCMSGKFELNWPLLCSNGLLRITETHGTNWGGFGFRFDHYEGYDAHYKKQYDDMYNGAME